MESTVNSELSTRIFEFFADRRRGEFVFVNNAWIYALLRSRYDEETDFFYLLHAYHAHSVHSLGGKAEFAGIYSHSTGKLYGASYDLRFLEAARLYDMTEVYDMIVARSTEAILRKIGGKPVTETEESKKPWRDRDYYLKYELDKEAMRCFFDGALPAYHPKIDKDHLSLADLIGAINHPEETADCLADEYITQNNKIINQRLWELTLLPDKVAEYETMPGEHHYQRKIARVVGDEKMVRLELMKDGISCECKIKTDALKRTGESDYSSYYLDASGRAAFIGAYGRCARLFASDIQRICYGKKVLYQKDEQ